MTEKQLTRYWIDFGGGGRWPHGCGVTACDWDDALSLVQSVVLDPMGLPEMPPIRAVKTDVDVSTLDPWNVLPNVVVPPNWRGVWYPERAIR